MMQIILPEFIPYPQHLHALLNELDSLWRVTISPPQPSTRYWVVYPSISADGYENMLAIK